MEVTPLDEREPSGEAFERRVGALCEEALVRRRVAWEAQQVPPQVEAVSVREAVELSQQSAQPLDVELPTAVKVGVGEVAHLLALVGNFGGKRVGKRWRTCSLS